MLRLYVAKRPQRLRAPGYSKKREHAPNVHGEGTPEARAARLQQMREHAQVVCSEESQEAQENRLERMRVNAEQHQANRLVQSTCPVFGQSCVQKKVANFHSKLAECVCSTCSESLPVIKYQIPMNMRVVYLTRSIIHKIMAWILVLSLKRFRD